MKPNAAKTEVLIHKACPVVLRSSGNSLDILAFRHPLAGSQLVKGTVDGNESASQAALRELAEESGISNATPIAELGEFVVAEESQRWSLILCDAPNLPETWEHFCEDDGGHVFRFFWQDLSTYPDESWHPLFRIALDEVRRAIIDASENT